ncbi:uncharacterized protein BYT42DRAFT_29242 [Radiomyces spectabilis]|uniref:uncharacterized protein n=1 Tax=Radiomyces spectabilis TaxID=64574 RepID=UPI00221F7683|nr:uncharacterized protein BYT42DRAFT_29242 [Radiomyces spectabilis]KAI8394066.1 hypothetical protein BYT42DRAFT_29242 [Radiomyces spectabilis]
MRMRNPLKPKSKRRQFVELQDDRGFSPAQFETPETPIPWKAIGLATLLFSVGSLLIVIGALIKTGFITSEVWLSRGLPFLILGSIMFIPGKCLPFVSCLLRILQVSRIRLCNDT